MKLGDIAEVVGGVKTYDNKSYVCSADGIGRYEKVPDGMIVDRDLTEAEKSNGVKVIGENSPRYVQFDKSGDMITNDGRLLNYYKPPEFYIDWSREAVAYYAENNGLRNKHRYFQNGITYSVTGVYAPTFRLGCGQVFGQKGATLFTSAIHHIELLGILCSLCCRFLVKNYLSHGVDATDSLIEQIPIPVSNSPKLIELVQTVIDKLRVDLTYDYAANEQNEINQLVYKSYGLNKEDIQEVENWYARRYPRLNRA